MGRKWDAAMLNDRPSILVIDDDDVTRSMMTDILEQEDYAVHCSTDGRAGLRRVLMGNVDLVLLDLVLPDYDGAELCREVHATEKDHHLPVIMVTAMPGDVQGYARAAGADDFLAKPFDNDELLGKVRTWLRDSDPGTGPSEAAGSRN